MDDTTPFAARLRALSKDASPGPWEADATDPSDVVVWGPRQNDDQRLLMNVGGANPHQVGVAFDIDAPNAALIVALRNHADRLADLVERVADLLAPQRCGLGVAPEGYALNDIDVAHLAKALAALDALDGGGA